MSKSTIHQASVALERSARIADAEKHSYAIRSLFHAVRCRYLQIPHCDYAKQIGSSRQSISRFLRSDTVNDDLQYRILDDWRARQTSVDVTSRSIPLFREARYAMAELFVGKDRGTTHGFLRWLRYLEGQETFEEQTGIKRDAVRARKKNNTLTPFMDLVKAVIDIGYEKNQRPSLLLKKPIIQRAQATYVHHAVEHKGKDPCSSTVVTLLQAYGYSTRTRSLQHGWQLPHQMALDLSSQKKISSRDADNLLQKMMSKKIIHSSEARQFSAAWHSQESGISPFEFDCIPSLPVFDPSVTISKVLQVQTHLERQNNTVLTEKNFPGGLLSLAKLAIEGDSVYAAGSSERKAILAYRFTKGIDVTDDRDIEHYRKPPPIVYDQVIQAPDE